MNKFSSTFNKLSIFDVIGKEYDSIEGLKSGIYLIFDGDVYKKIHIDD